jgi:hypothetical protein
MMIHSLYLKTYINFVLGHRSWLGCYNEYGGHLGAVFHTYLGKPMIWSQLGQQWVDTDLF